MSAKLLKRHIDQAMGREPADLVIKNVQILDVLTGNVRTGDIAVCGETIIGVYDNYEGKEEIDGTGLYATPGFIDTHLHVESSLVTPYEFERMVLPRGTTTAVCDPHEMANVIGSEAFRYFLDSSDGMVMDLVVNLSSCVPATNIGTSGADVEAEDIAPYKDRAHGLAEVMNIGGMATGDEKLLEKLALFIDGHVDGHMPGLGLDESHGKLLNALASANIKTDHESTTMKEAIEKQARGIRTLIREGTAAKNLEALMPFITKENSYTTAFCTDDFHPADIVEEGHINHIIRKAISLYEPALHGDDKQEHVTNVYRMATWAAAQIFGLTNGLKRRGELAPGAIADIVLLSDLETCAVEQVVKAGRPVNETVFENRPAVDPAGLGSVKTRTFTANDFKVEAKNGDSSVTAIKVIPNNILTEAVETEALVIDGYLQADPANDVIKAAVIERHGRTNGNIGIGFTRGFEFEAGAIAATVGHDDHNITVVGVSDEEMALAANALKDMGGGYVVVRGNKVEAALPLPVAGLMSDQNFETVAAQEQVIRQAAKSLLTDGHEGLPQPLISMAFMSLSVIPDIRLCDTGMTRNDGTGPVLVDDQRNGPKP